MKWSWPNLRCHSSICLKDLVITGSVRRQKATRYLYKQKHKAAHCIVPSRTAPCCCEGRTNIKEYESKVLTRKLGEERQKNGLVLWSNDGNTGENT